MGKPGVGNAFGLEVLFGWPARGWMALWRLLRLPRDAWRLLREVMR